MELHLFDFDGTLTRKDTLFEFARFCHGPFRFYAGLLVLAPVLALIYLGFIDKDKGKVIFLKYFFRNKSWEYLERRGQEFSVKRLPQLLRPAGIDTINRLKEKNHQVAIVSASLDIWLRPFCERYGLKMICTRARFDQEGKFTGTFVGANCNRQEKRRRVAAEFNLKDYRLIVAYGDSRDDHHLFSLSTHYYYRPFASH